MNLGIELSQVEPGADMPAILFEFCDDVFEDGVVLDRELVTVATDYLSGVFHRVCTSIDGWCEVLHQFSVWRLWQILPPEYWAHFTAPTASLSSFPR